MKNKPFRMKGSPMQRNFGIGEKEEVSPGKVIPKEDENGNGNGNGNGNVDKNGNGNGDGNGDGNGKKKKKKIWQGIGDVIQSAIDAGSGTSHQAKKEAKREANLTREQKAADDELKHQREMEKIEAMSKPKIEEEE